MLELYFCPHPVVPGGGKTASFVSWWYVLTLLCCCVSQGSSHTQLGQSHRLRLHHQTKASKKNSWLELFVPWIFLSYTISRPEGLARLTESVSGIKLCRDTGTRQVNSFCSQQGTPPWAAGFSWSQALVVSVWVLQAASTKCPGWDGIKLGTTGMS